VFIASLGDGMKAVAMRAQIAMTTMKTTITTIVNTILMIKINHSLVELLHFASRSAEAGALWHLNLPDHHLSVFSGLYTLYVENL